MRSKRSKSLVDWEVRKSKRLKKQTSYLILSCHVLERLLSMDPDKATVTLEVTVYSKEAGYGRTI